MDNREQGRQTSQMLYVVQSRVIHATRNHIGAREWSARFLPTIEVFAVG
jgi:hypothetical protein